MVASEDWSTAPAMPCYTLGAMRRRSVLALVALLALGFFAVGWFANEWVPGESGCSSAQSTLWKGMETPGLSGGQINQLYYRAVGECGWDPDIGPIFAE